MHILLIDDEIHVIENLNLYLTSRNHTCTELTRTSTIQHLHHYLTQNQPECVILDFGMIPGGDVIYGWIKSWRSSTRVIFYTNYSDSTAEHARMLNAGASSDEIIAKREVGSDVDRILRVLS